MATYTAGHVEVRVTPNLDGFHRKIQQTMAKVRDITVEVKADTKVADAQLRKFEKSRDLAVRVDLKLDRARKQLDGLQRGLQNATGKMSGLAKASIKAAAAIVSIGGAANMIGGLGAALAAASGAALLLPGAIGAGIAAAGALKLAFAGVGDALKAVAEGDAEKLAEAMQGLAPGARAFVQAVQDVRGSFVELQQSVQGAFFDGLAGPFREMATAVLPTLQAGLSGIASEFGSIAERAMVFVAQKGVIQDLNEILTGTQGIVRNLGDGFTPLLRVFTTLGAVATPIIAELTQGFGAWAQNLAVFVDKAAATGQLEQWIRNGIQAFSDLFGIIGNVGGILAEVFGAANQNGASLFAVLREITGQVREFLASAQGQEILNTIFTTLRQTVDALKPGLAALAGALLDIVVSIAPSLPALGQAFSAVAQALAPILSNLGELVASILPPLAQFITQNAPLIAGIAVTIGGVAVAVKAVNGAMVAGQAIMKTWTALTNGVTIAQKALNGAMKANPIGLVIAAITALVAGLVWAYNNIDWFRNAVNTAWNAVGAVFGWVWNNVLKPVFDAIGAVAQWLWTNVLSPVFQWIADKWREHLTAMQIAWNTVLKPTWDALSAAAQWLWNNVLRPVFDSIGRGWDALLNGMKWVWDNILRPAFDAIKSAIQSVGEAFSRVSGWIRDTWSKISGYAKTPIQFVVDVVYNNGIRPVWNGIAEVFGLGKLNPVHFAGGGVLPGYAPGKDTIPAMLSPGEAVLTPEATRLIGPGNILALNKAASGRKPGSTGGYGVPHFAGGGIVGTVIGGIGSFFGDLFTKGPVEAVKSVFRKVLRDSERTPGAGLWTDAAKKLPLKVVDSVIEKAKSFLSGGFGGGYGAFPVANVGAGVRRWAPLVLQALAMLGQPASYLGITLRRMQQESGGNPNAINLWDINAKRGTPSIGLMQVIGPTFSKYRDPRAPNNIYDPLANILASMRYALARYGSLPAAYNRPGGYDSGGWLPPTPNGYGTFYNYTGKPEAVLTNEQWNAIYKAAQNGMNTGSGINVTNQITTRVDASPESIAQAVTRQTKRAFRGAGVGV